MLFRKIMSRIDCKIVIYLTVIFQRLRLQIANLIYFYHSL